MDALSNKKKIIYSLIIGLTMGLLLSVYKLIGSTEGLSNTEIAIFLLFSVFTKFYTYISIVLFAGASYILLRYPIILKTIHKYRWPIAGAVFVLLVAFGISGSSAGCWLKMYGYKDENLLIGLSRDIRSDEWYVNTPFNLSRSNDGLPLGYFDTSISGNLIDAYMGYRIPVASVLELYCLPRIGFLFLDAGRALSFEWNLKLILLIMSSYEFGRLITKDRRGLSLLYTVILVLSPNIQWWFSTGIPTMLLTMQFSIVLFRIYLMPEKYKKPHLVRILSLIGILICAGNYIMTMYPAWMIPLAILIIAFGIHLIVSGKGKIHLNVLDIILTVLLVALFVGSFAYIYLSSKTAIEVTANTVYPGDFIQTGGDGAGLSSEYMGNLWTTLFKVMRSNRCEVAKIIGFFPLCYFIPVYAMIRNKKADAISVMLLSVAFVMTIWIAFGLPQMIAKLLLFTRSAPSRMVVILGFVQLLLVIRGITINKHTPRTVFAIILSLAMSAICGFMCLYMNSGSGFMLVLILISVVIYAFIFFGIMTYNTIYGKMITVYFTLLVSTLGGALVNPVRVGINDVLSMEWVKTIDEIDGSENDKLWAVVGDNYIPGGNICLLASAACINTTYVYPDLDRWHIIDEDAEYEYVYNRYCHCEVYIKESGDAEFELLENDAIRVTLTIDDLAKLGVDYITSRTPIENTSDNYDLEEIDGEEPYYVYGIVAVKNTVR